MTQCSTMQRPMAAVTASWWSAPRVFQSCPRTRPDHALHAPVSDRFSTLPSPPRLQPPKLRAHAPFSLSRTQPLRFIFVSPGLVGRSRTALFGIHPRQKPLNSKRGQSRPFQASDPSAPPSSRANIAAVSLAQIPYTVPTELHSTAMATSIKGLAAPPILRTSSPGPLAEDFARQQVAKQQKNNFHSSSLKRTISSSNIMLNNNVNKTALHPTGVQYVFSVLLYTSLLHPPLSGHSRRKRAHLMLSLSNC